MKTEVILSQDPQPAPATFPALYQDGDGSGLVVLFTSRNEGTVVHVGDDPHYVLGEHCNDFFDADNTDEWVRLPDDARVLLVQSR